MKPRRKGNAGMPHAVPHFFNTVGGKWKMSILYFISKDINHFNILLKTIPSINRQVLLTQLKELEQDQIIKKTILPQTPEKVFFQLTEQGKDLLPIIMMMQHWD
ncbi:helix-turn-helix domain-containing protein [Chryseobacterium sp.]|uniref:winged helix-turn-helix transcriptional regulator n=1 Tax=Chryseobacterium sp. TaxID=1871047 RepID=UPI0025C0826A|nr:helix-turn-helix domain-containing protein [Chryseobacterium sp.]